MMPWSALGGGGLPAFRQLRTTEQGSAPFDPAGLAQPGTAFTDGVFRLVLPASALIIDGLQEQQTCWTRRVRDEYPNYDPVVDILQHAMFLDVPPALTPDSNRWGICGGVIDTNTAGKAACQGLATAIVAVSAVAYQGTGVRVTATAGSIGLTGTPQLCVTTLMFASDGVGDTDMVQDWRVRNTLGAIERGGRTDEAPNFHDADDWRFLIGSVKTNAVATAGMDTTCRFFTRVIRRGTALPGLP